MHVTDCVDLDRVLQSDIIRNDLTNLYSVQNDDLQK